METDFMELGIKQALKTSKEGIGGPFGACIVKGGKVVSVASNSVLKDNDPTAHAEVNAIRLACKELGTYDLSGCVLYTTCYPCPMCLSAIIWSNIKQVYYGCSAKDAENIGFRDNFMYEFIKGGCKDVNIMALNQQQRDECIKVFNEYEGRTIY